MANCSVFWNNFSGSIPDSLLQFFIVYCSAVCIAGSVCNVLVVWCVVDCPRTRSSVKVLLCALFSSTLLMCLVVMPFMVHLSFAKLWCDRKVSMWMVRGMLLVYVVLTEMELIFIAVLAFLRSLAVWSPRRRHVKLWTSVALVVGVGLYATLTTLGLMVPYWVDAIDGHTRTLIGRAMNVLHFFLPVVLTLICYISMIFVVRRNKRRLAASQHEATDAGQQEVMDQATRAMLAVFVSNLLLCLPHSIYHILPQNFRVVSYVIVHCVFYTHLFVDPLAYMCSNAHHRRRVLHTLASCTRWATCRQPAPSPPHAASILPLYATPPTSDHESRKDLR